MELMELMELEVLGFNTSTLPENKQGEFGNVQWVLVGRLLVYWCIGYWGADG